MSIVYLLGFLWSMPLSIWGWLLGIFLAITGQISKLDFDSNYILTWDMRDDGWFCRKFFKEKGWAGYSCGSNIFVVDTNGERWRRTIKHETMHCYQQYIFGILLPFLYIFNSIFIWLFMKDKHSYYDNRFEKAARKYAGQKVNIPKSEWPKGLQDRWAWW